MTTILLAALFICHFASDFAFTRQRMLIAKSKGWPPFPIMEHAAVHAVTMSAAFAIYGIEWKTIGILFLVEWVSHYVIDSIKGLLSRWFPSVGNSRKKAFWVAYGIDQLLHAFVIIGMWHWAIHGNFKDLTMYL